MTVYDVIIIGSGPGAIAALMGLPKGMRGAVITGGMSRTDSARKNITLKGVHPKIATESLLHNEAPGLSNPMFFSGQKSALFQTATRGGLANYWGQQFLRYRENDPWPHDIFSNFEDYISSCQRVEAYFSYLPDQKESPTNFSGYRLSRPNLLVGLNKPNSLSKLPFRYLFSYLVNLHGFDEIEQSALYWRRQGQEFCVYCTEKFSLVGRRILLAAGTVGSLRLFLASYEDVLYAKFRDHAPYMIYLLGGRSKLVFKSQEEWAHFMNGTIEKERDEETLLFSSLYRLSCASVALLLSTLGIPPFCLKYRLPEFLDCITPIQVWTQKSFMEYQFSKNYKQASVVSLGLKSKDKELKKYTHWMRNHGRILKISTTRAGYGFHYHNAEISRDGKQFVSLPSALAHITGEKIMCCDGSTLSNIGCRPHSLTLMTAAYKIGQSLERT